MGQMVECHATRLRGTPKMHGGSERFEAGPGVLTRGESLHCFGLAGRKERLMYGKELLHVLK